MEIFLKCAVVPFLTVRAVIAHFANGEVSPCGQPVFQRCSQHALKY